MRKLFLILFSLLFFLEVKAQDNNIDSSQSEGCFLLDKKFISAAAVSFFYIGTLVDSYNTWWKDSKRPFRFLNADWFDQNGDKGMDKIGHFYTSYFFYKAQKDIFLWGGYPERSSKIISGGLTFLMSLLIEVGDGFSRYGFDYRDFVFNTGGLTYAVLQDEIPFMNNFNFKFSYFPSEGFSFPPKFSSHYEGHIYWLTVNAAGIVNHFTDYGWPEYIQPAVGYSISEDLGREYVIGLDLNLLPLFKEGTPLLGYIGDVINLFHIPFPGIKYSGSREPEYKLLLLN